MSVATQTWTIFSGKHDPLLQFKTLIEFVTDAPSYGQLVDDDVIEDITDALPSCADALQECESRKKTDKSDDLCNDAIIKCVCSHLHRLNKSP